MKKIVLIFVVALAFVFNLVVTVGALPPDSQQTKTVPRDIRAVMDGRFTFDYWGENFWDFYTLGDVTGTMKHLGLAKMYTKHTPNADGTLSDGEFRIVAANGDEIQGTYEGAAAYISADQALGNALFVISGGTGRFAGATGTIIVSFLETFDDPTWASVKISWNLAGTVDY